MEQSSFWRRYIRLSFTSDKIVHFRLEEATCIVLVCKTYHVSSARCHGYMYVQVTIIGKLSHRNLVPLKGWCYEHDELLIVYEYMPKGSLADHLYPQPAEGDSLGLDWVTRLRIIQGVADALGYLHGGSKQSVVHRDIKPSNVMLDVNFVPKLGDFGLAVAMQQDKESQTVTQTAGQCTHRTAVG